MMQLSNLVAPILVGYTCQRVNKSTRLLQHFACFLSSRHVPDMYQPILNDKSMVYKVL
jgi:hypothetical protein